MPEENTMRKYRATTNTFVDGRLVRQGQEFYTDQPKSKAWELLKAKADDETEGSEKKEGKTPVKEVVAQIAEMTDVAELANLKEDSRKTVADAAEKRIRELAGPAPGADE